MLSVSPAVRIFVHALPTDMRKHFDGLAAIVSHSFGKDILHGDYFVFLNRARNRCKVLFWDRDGLVVWAKRLAHSRLVMMITSSDVTIAWCRLRGGAIGNFMSLRARWT